jgi:Flp pilus assembly protein TadD
LGHRILEEVATAVTASEARDPLPEFLRRLVPRRAVPVAEVNAALFFAMTGAYANAELLFRAALDKAPGDPRLHYDLGLVLDRAGRRDEALRAFEAALMVAPRFAPALVARGLCRSAAGDEEAALRDWALADRGGGLGPRSLQARGAILARRGRLDEAIEDLRRAVRLDPSDPRPRAGLGLLYRKRGLRAQAEREIALAVAADPLGCVARAAQARLGEADGDRDQAMRIYREILAVHPACPEAVTGAGVLLVEAGRKGEAIALVTAALAAGMDPAHLSAEPGLRMLRAEPGPTGSIVGGDRAGPVGEESP